MGTDSIFATGARGSKNIDEAGGTYDVWIQGGAATSGDARNLAMLGVDEDSGDYLVINYGGEYAGGTRIQSDLPCRPCLHVGPGRPHLHGKRRRPGSHVSSSNCILSRLVD